MKVKFKCPRLGCGKSFDTERGLNQHKSKAHPFGGDWHQSEDNCVPVFEDNTVAHFSFRGWGDLLAAIWSEKEDRDYTYMDFYMGKG